MTPKVTHKTQSNTERQNTMNTATATSATKSRKIRTVKTGNVGRPAYVLNFPRGKFNTAKAFAANDGVCKLTVRQGIDKAVAAGTLTKLKEVKTTGKAGRPSFLFISTAQLSAASANLSKAKSKAKTVAPATAETVAADSTPTVA